MTGENDWTGELQRAREAIQEIRDRGMVGGVLFARALGAVLDLVNHVYTHHQVAIAGLAAGRVEVEVEGKPLMSSESMQPGSVEELTLLRELAAAVQAWAIIDQADAATRRPLEDDMVRLAARWHREVLNR